MWTLTIKKKAEESLIPYSYFVRFIAIQNQTYPCLHLFSLCYFSGIQISLVFKETGKIMKKNKFEEGLISALIKNT